MRGKKRPLDERAHAVGIAVVAGGAEASRQTGIPENTIYDWMGSPEFVELRERTKEIVSDEWWAGVQAYQRSIMEDLHSASLRDKVGAFAIMFEKLSLLRGEATARTESKDITHDLDDHEAAILGEAIRSELARRADEHAEEFAVESPAPD